MVTSRSPSIRLPSRSQTTSMPGVRNPLLTPVGVHSNRSLPEPCGNVAVVPGHEAEIVDPPPHLADFLAQPGFGHPSAVPLEFASKPGPSIANRGKLTGTKDGVGPGPLKQLPWPPLPKPRLRLRSRAGPG